MMTSLEKPLASLSAILKLIVVACWSFAQLSAWFIASSIGHIFAIFAACRAVENERSDMSIVYNALNYPDEVAPLT
jgi:hypothetical protein